MARPTTSCSLLVALALLLISAPAVHSAGGASRCSACRAVADELIARLDAEVPRNHLDMRHRLDKDGKRWGPVIDYKMSELRVIHLLEGMCEDLGSKNQQVPDLANGPDALRWARTESLDGSRYQGSWDAPSEQRKQQRRSLENYCHDLLERHEDELSQALRGNKVDANSASDFLCHLTARHCDQPLAEEEAARAAAEAAAEAEAAALEAEAAAGAEAAAKAAEVAEAAAKAEAEAEAAAADAGTAQQGGDGAAVAAAEGEQPAAAVEEGSADAGVAGTAPREEL